MNRLDFIDCPLCAGHEKIGADTADALCAAIHGRKFSTEPHVTTELENIRNAIQNAREPGRGRLAAEPAGFIDPLFD